MAVVQGTVLYGVELTWNGKKGVAREYQDANNRMGRSPLVGTPRDSNSRERADSRKGAP